MGEEGVVYTKSHWATFIDILTGLLQSLLYKKLKSNTEFIKKNGLVVKKLVTCRKMNFSMTHGFH